MICCVSALGSGAAATCKPCPASGTSSIARSEYRGWPPRDLRRGAAQCFRASPVIQTVKSPRFRQRFHYTRTSSSPEYFFFANLCRREVLNLCGIKHIRGRGKSLKLTLDTRSVQQRHPKTSVMACWILADHTLGNHGLSNAGTAIHHETWHTALLRHFHK